MQLNEELYETCISMLCYENNDIKTCKQSRHGSKITTCNQIWGKASALEVIFYILGKKVTLKYTIQCKVEATGMEYWWKFEKQNEIKN